MRDPAIIGLSPSLDNIKYHVEPLISVKNFCELLAAKIRTNCTSIPKTLIFCSTIAKCSLMYRTLRNMLGSEFTDPPE